MRNLACPSFKRLIGLVAKRKRVTWSVVTVLGLAALAAILAFSPLKTFLSVHGNGTASAAAKAGDDKQTEGARPAEEECLVRAQVVGSVKDSREYVYSGEVRGRYESMLAFQAGGRIIKRNVQLGDVVHAGDILMEIDPKDIKESVALASAQVRAAESQVRLAEVNLGRFQRLHRDGAIPKQQLDQTQTAYDAASAARDQAAALRAVSANQLEYTLLRADQDGVIAGVMAEIGQVVGPGTPVIVLVREGDREIEISVPENRIDSLHKVKGITVSFWALSGVELIGEIRETAPMADPILRTYKTRIRLLSPPADVKLGMTASVRVETDDNGAHIRLVPLSAIYQENDKPNVWLVKDGKLELQPVELDGFGTETVRVVRGLEDGDVVVTAGVHKLTRGQKVRISEGAKS